MKDSVIAAIIFIVALAACIWAVRRNERKKPASRGTGAHTKAEKFPPEDRE